MTTEGDVKMTEKEPANRASRADKIALGAGAALTIVFAAGLHVARKSGKALRRYTAINPSQQGKDYWQVAFDRDGIVETRYYHGSEPAICRRLKHLRGSMQIVKKLSETEVQKIKTDRARIIEI